MLTNRPPKPALGRRAVSRHEKRKFDRLAAELEKFWGNGSPSGKPLAPEVIYGSGFFSMEDPSDVLKQRLKGAVLIDLGAGSAGSFLAMAHFAAAYGVREYIAVDRYADYSSAERGMEQFVHQKYPETVFRAVNDDMLRFIGHQPDESASVCMVSIDSAILASKERFATEEYMQEIAMQIARVVPLDGVAFGANSPALFGLESFGFKGSFENPGYIFTREY